MKNATGTSEPMTGDWRDLGLGKGQRWAFIGGDWREDEQGVIRPPETNVDEHLALYRSQTFSDFEAEFEWRWDMFCCGGGFVFRARDARHYYLIEFPCTGQQYRAEYFWACVSKVDESGWAEVLKTEIVHGVPSEIGLWHRCKLLVRGNQIRLWVDGRPFSLVCDDTYSASGHVGLHSYSELGECASLAFRNVRIRGQAGEGECWNESVQPVQNWFYPTVEETHGTVHHLGGLAKAPDGDLLMTLNAGEEFHGKEWTPVIIRSTDNGRTWSGQQRLPDHVRDASPHCTRDGRLRMMKMKSEPPFTIAMAPSNDNGETWSEFEDCGKLEFPADVDIAVANSLLELSDGTLVWFLYRHTTKPAEDENDYGSFCVRSGDGCRTWSAPVSLNGPGPAGFERYKMIKKHFGSETSAAQTRDGRIVAFVRPFFDPVMWETWSDDGGRSWTPASRGPFGMWAATSSMLSTGSGALLIAGRHPGLAFQISYDDAMSWTCYRFDTTFWANGITLEIEPDLVMYASTAKYGEPRVRAHLFRITPDGPEPVRY